MTSYYLAPKQLLYYPQGSTSFLTDDECRSKMPIAFFLFKSMVKLDTEQGDRRMCCEKVSRCYGLIDAPSPPLLLEVLLMSDRRYQYCSRLLLPRMIIFVCHVTCRVSFDTFHQDHRLADVLHAPATSPVQS